MDYIDNVTVTIDQITRFLPRLERFMDNLLNLPVDQMMVLLESIESRIAEMRQDALAIMSMMEPVSLTPTDGYWTRGGLQRRWISYRGRSKRGGRSHRGWGQRRYAWRPFNYQQVHNYSHQARNDARSLNMRRGNLPMLMPASQEGVMDVLPLVQPATWPATTEPTTPLYSEAQPQWSEATQAQPQWSEATQAQPPLSDSFTPPSVFAQPARAQLQSLWPQSRVVLPSVRLFSRRSRAQPSLTRQSMGRALFAQRNRAPTGLVRPIFRPQPAMGEPNQIVYEQRVSTPIVPEPVPINPIVPEPEQVVPVPTISDIENENISF